MQMTLAYEGFSMRRPYQNNFVYNRALLIK